MTKRTELNRMSGNHFFKLFDIVEEVADEIGDATLAAVADYLAMGVNSLREQRACA